MVDKTLSTWHMLRTQGIAIVIITIIIIKYILAMSLSILFYVSYNPGNGRYQIKT